MPSALNALPTITSTALGSGTNMPGGIYKNPTAVAGFMVGMDSLNFYVQAAPNPTSGVLLNITSTATGTNTSGISTNTVHRGTTLLINTVSVNATCTLGVNLLANDTVGGSGLSVPVARASLDGIVASGMYAVVFYPALPNSGGGPSQTPSTNYTQTSGVLPLTYRFSVSLTATASGGGANVSYTIAEQKTL